MLVRYDAQDQRLPALLQKGQTGRSWRITQGNVLRLRVAHHAPRQHLPEVGYRLGRVEPRAIKRRSKLHDLLTEPRKDARNRLMRAA